MAFLVEVVPGGDVGIAIILLTVIVKLILFPLSKKSIESQAKMALLAPEQKKIKDSGASKEEQARLTFELFKKHNTSPFSGCLLILIQFPIIIALYSVFYKGIHFNPDVLYSFINIPDPINNIFLGFIDLTHKSLPLAILAAISQYFQALYMPKPSTANLEKGSFQESFSKSMTTNLKYVFPVFIFLILYTDFLGVSLSGAVALYWATSNIFAIGQQIYLNKKEHLSTATKISQLD